MIEYSPYRTLVVYEDIRRARKWYNNFVEHYADAIQRVRKGLNEMTIILKDDSIIDIVPFTDGVRGYRADCIYYDYKISEEDAWTYLSPRLTRHNIYPIGKYYDEDTKDK